MLWIENGEAFWLLPPILGNIWKKKNSRAWARDELLPNHLFIARGCDWINNLLIFYTSFLVPPSLFSIPSWEWWLVERVFVFSIPSSNNGLPLYRLSSFFFYSPVPSTLQYTRSINQVTWKWGRTRMKELCIQPGTDHIFYDGSSFNWTEDSFYPRSFFLFFLRLSFLLLLFLFRFIFMRMTKKKKKKTFYSVPCNSALWCMLHICI